MRRYYIGFLCCVGFLSFHLNGMAAPDWQPPTQEELSMTSEPAAPGAAAVILYKEQRSDDNMQSNELFVREKILTEAAKKDADIEIPYNRRTYSVTSISGRTIHKDGSIIPFTGKAFDKLLLKGSGIQYRAKIFSLPDVQVGSIIEYRYTTRYDDRYTIPPTWILQSEYYTRKLHYHFVPLSMLNGAVITDMISHRTSNGLEYVSILPPGVTPKYVRMASSETSGTGPKSYWELDATNVKALAKEEFQPPIAGLSYRVMFYNSFFDNAEKFWKGEGGDWSKHADKFIGPGSAVSQAVSQIVTASDTPEQKLRKIYSAVMAIENTDFTREHSAEEAKSVGETPIKTTDDIWTRRRGNSDQITKLFVAMARAAGMQAYLMEVTNRDQNIFQFNLPSLSQLDDDIAIVQIDGKDQFFDPGSRYCTYGQLNWKHSSAGGLRQIAGGSAIATAPAMNYKDSLKEWAARLQMDNSGEVTGIVQMRYTGAPALQWRQAILKGDLTEETKALEDLVRTKLPGGINVKMKRLGAPGDPNQPLLAVFDISGSIATGTSKRLFIPGQIFQTSNKSPFVSPVRVNAVYFDYPYTEVDDVQITPPAGIAVESMPKTESDTLQQSAFYGVDSAMKGNSISIIRRFAIGTFWFPSTDYPDLKAFYEKVAVGDQQQLVLKTTASAGASGN